ncbi:MAG: pilus assembly protein N-terminal domain-containing protein [bacterium]
MNGFTRLTTRFALVGSLAAGLVIALGQPARAQTADADLIRVSLPVGRSYPIHTVAPVTRVSVASPTVADVVVIGERDIVINARTTGETDVIMWSGADRRHYRVLVNPPTDRRQVSLAIIFAEVRKDALHELGISALYRDKHVRLGSGVLRNDAQVDAGTGQVTLPTSTDFFTAVTNFGLNDVLATLEAQESQGNARLLARPNLMTANRVEGTFLAGGEIPVPIAQPGQGGQTFVTISYREFGIRLKFTPEILSDSLITLAVAPEVSTLDYTNAVTIAGFRVPALQTRRVETTVDVQPNQSLVISGLMSENRERVRSGIPFLMDIPILGNLFSSSRWQSSQTELLVIVTPTIVDPTRPPARDILRVLPDTTLPAREVLEEATTPLLPPSPRPRTP